MAANETIPTSVSNANGPGGAGLADRLLSRSLSALFVASRSCAGISAWHPGQSGRCFTRSTAWPRIAKTAPIGLRAFTIDVGGC